MIYLTSFYKQEIMGKIYIQYYSETGNTQQMADRVAQGATRIEGIQVRLKNIEESTIDDILWADGIALGAPTHLASVPWKVKKFWDEIVGDAWGKIDGKIGCAFSSSGGLGGGHELTCMALLTILLNYGMMVFGITDYVALQRTLHYGAALPGAPRTQAEKDICIRLGQRLAEFVSFYVDGVEENHPNKVKYERFINE
jgi:NAD(P)H dehydrogenase (quinone)